jgi:hypothetical protein
MPRNPFTVLGLPLDATPETIKGAWRGLARQHHPDVASGDPAVERRANRTMAEINAAYQELRDPVKRRAHREAAARAARAEGRGDPMDGHAASGRPTGSWDGTDGYSSPSDRPEWPPRPRTGRPVTARIDTSALLRPRNSTLHPLDHSPLPGLPPRPRSAEDHEPPRASTPTGPMLRRRGPSMELDMPTVAEAMATQLNFGKFAGLTLGEVALNEPTYLDWIVRTIDREPEVSLAARVVLRFLYGPMRRPRLDTMVQRG